MNQNEKICSAFRQDIELPAIVTQKADAAFEQILSESHKEKDKMKEEQKNTEPPTLATTFKSILPHRVQDMER